VCLNSLAPLTSDVNATNCVIIIVTESGIVASKKVLPKDRRQDDTRRREGVYSSGARSVSERKQEGEGEDIG